MSSAKEKRQNSDSLQEAFALLDDQERLFLSVLAQMPSGVFVAEAPSGRIIYHNEEAGRLLGHEPIDSADVSRYQAYHAVHEDDTPYTSDEYPAARALQGEAIQHREIRYIRGDGKRIYLSVSATPVRGGDGTIVATVTTFHDITALKEVERKLRESERRFRVMADNLPLIVWVHDKEGKQEFVNRTFTEFFGVSGQEMKDGRWQLLMHPEDAQSYGDAFAQAVSEQKPFEAEVRVRRHDGQWRWIRSWALPRFDHAEVFLGHVGASADVTEEKTVQRALEQSEYNLAQEARAVSNLHENARRLLGAPDESSALVGLLEAVMSVQEASMGCVHLLDPSTEEFTLLAHRGYPEGAVDTIELIYEGDGERLPSKTLKTGGPLLIEDVRSSLLSGRYLSFAAECGFRAVHAAPLLSRAGEFIGVLSTQFRAPALPTPRVLRLTELHLEFAAEVVSRMRASIVLNRSKHDLEERVAERTAELEEQTRRLRTLADQLATKEHQDRKRFAALLHDELQQYLVAAKLNLYRARRDAKETSSREALEKAANMIDEALNSSRDLTQQLRPPVLYEDGLLPALRWLGAELSRRYDIPVEVEVPERELALQNDTRAFLFSSVQELLFNSIKHAEADKVLLRADILERTLSIAVEDHGIGLPFDHDSSGETGLGLFTVRERLAAIGGSMTIESEPNDGTRVTLTVPIAEADVAAADSQPAASSEYPEPLAPEDGNAPENLVSVMLVDDHVIARKGVAALIEEEEGVRVVAEAVSGEEALRLMEERLPRVVVLDINMPGMSGIEAARIMRSRWPSLRIIGMSVQDDESTRKSFLAAGGDEFVSKSAEADRLRYLLTVTNREDRPPLA